MKKKILKLTSNDKRFPQSLLSLPEKEIPARLFVLGEIKDKDKKAIAIVGTRKTSDYGERIAFEFAKKLSLAGFTIISGLARGIDSIAHKGALSVGGRTIAVLGSGVNYVYPSENKELAKRIQKSGAVISEYAVNQKPEGKNFLERNRIIAGLSLAVVVVEGKRRSGTLSTASWAANYGREVFAVPGPIDSPSSAAPHYLIKNGAKLVENPRDILEDIKNMLE